ncbi:DNA primase [Candidatus Magnetominusculus xianensis]|uniref:DNA primase n=1 Tax=Candidatus Magnetominusculus xianensis TaxID=1748249 RepID=A0ABR5SJU4_9BACT|nr:DNA primase [Candidatus Magnetominusculus xianensis]KWT86943.1 DNA primase [Candidatus Magnetominusculus xianensis]MBF0403933.1 DNA primase [Nitrospirota bacterium]
MDFQGIREEIKSRIDIVDVISDYVGLKKSGTRYKGLCPFHTEKTPSFVVSPEKQVFYCFGCGMGGDIITFVMKEEGMSYNEAIRKLSERAGIKLEINQNVQEREVLLQIHRAAAAFFKDQLRKSEKALKYLHTRGIGKESIERFSIGAAPEGWDTLFRHLKKEGFQDRHLRLCGVVVYKEHSQYDLHRDRIMFPIHNSSGDIVAFGGRAIEKNIEPKYLNSPETIIFQKKRILFGLNAAKEGVKGAKHVNIVEGYTDVVMCHQYGFTNTVAPLGTALTEDHTKLLMRFTKEVVVIFDGDDAGVRAAKRALPIILKGGLAARALLLPEKNDPDSYLKTYGAGEFKGLLSKTRSYVEFMLTNAGYGVDNLREIYDTLAAVEDTVLRAQLVTELSNKASISESVLTEKLKKVYKPMRTARIVKQRGKMLDEEILLGIYLSVPDIAEMFKPMMDMDLQGLMENELIKRIFKEFFSGTTAPTIEGLSKICTEEEVAYITGLMVNPNVDPNIGRESIEKNIEGCIKNLKKKWLKKKLDEIQEKINKASLANNIDELALLLQESKKYNNEKRGLF